MGVAIVLMGLSPSINAYAHASITGHMIQHLLLGMYAPIALVMAAPVTLALASLPTASARSLVGFMNTPGVRYISHPVTAMTLDIGAMFVLYLTPLYTAMHGQPVFGALLKLHFMLAGCLFVWAIVGPDPAPRRPGPGWRLSVLFVAMALHGTLSKYMYLHGYPLDSGTSFVARQTAAEWMYYGGDGAAALMAILFFSARRNQRAVPEF